jgi:DNA-binding NarL/FixJ family response regulator
VGQECAVQPWVREPNRLLSPVNWSREKRHQVTASEWEVDITTAAGCSDSAAGPIRLALISAIRVAREALSALLEDWDGAIAVVHLGDPRAGSIAPLSESENDVVLVDGSCRDSLEALPGIRRTLPGVVVVVYGVQPVRKVLLSCARNGASILASCDTTTDALVELVKQAAGRELEGGAQLNAALLRELARRQVDAAEIAALTRREREIALALAGGLSNKEIAERFCISLPTVKSHVHCILRKLSIDRRDEVLSRLRGVVPI